MVNCTLSSGQLGTKTMIDGIGTILSHYTRTRTDTNYTTVILPTAILDSKTDIPTITDYTTASVDTMIPTSSSTESQDLKTTPNSTGVYWIILLGLVILSLVGLVIFNERRKKTDTSSVTDDLSVHQELSFGSVDISNTDPIRDILPKGFPIIPVAVTESEHSRTSSNDSRIDLASVSVAKPLKAFKSVESIYYTCSESSINFD